MTVLGICLMLTSLLFNISRSGLLVGLEETEGSVLCLYDLGLSRVVKAVVIPGRVSCALTSSTFSLEEEIYHIIPCLCVQNYI